MKSIINSDLNITNLIINTGDEFSECKSYRYKLWNIWNEKPLAMCIGLNPSLATKDKKDPTITNLIKMLDKLGYGGFYMMNLFAWVSPHPKDLLSCPDAIGENDCKLKEVEGLCKDVIFCWGNFKLTEARILQVVQKYPSAKCFGKTKSGKPLHPLALMYAGLSNSPTLMNYEDNSPLYFIKLLNDIKV